MQQIIIYLVTSIVLHVGRHLVIYAHQIVPKRRDHEELLHHTVHITDTSQVDKPDIFLASVATVRTGWLIFPPFGLFDQCHERNQLVINKLFH